MSGCPISFLFNDTATTEIYTLSLHDALPIFAYLVINREAYHQQQDGISYVGNRLRAFHALWEEAQNNLMTSRLHIQGTKNIVNPAQFYFLAIDRCLPSGVINLGEYHNSTLIRSEERRVGKECR